MSFLNYIRRKPPEMEILDGLNKHLNLCVKAADLLSEATNHKMNGDQAKAHATYKEVTQTEEEADYQRREIIDKLAKGVLPPISKEDMMNLVSLLDTVVDWTNTSSQLLDMIDFKDIPNITLALFTEQIKLGNQCVHALKDTIQTLYDDYSKAQDHRTRDGQHIPPHP
jgi:predicted phosphate transport protein (TIGR00153 family)